MSEESASVQGNDQNDQSEKPETKNKDEPAKTNEKEVYFQLLSSWVCNLIN